MPIQERLFGQIDGKPVVLYTLSNSNGMSAEITNYGGIVVAFRMPDREGHVKNICLGFDTPAEYEKGHPYFGCIVGRFANRIRNGRFSMNGKEYTLPKNLGEHHLHGGISGFDKKIWNAESFSSSEACGLVLKYRSEDGEEGYPGALDVTVVYSLNEENELTINYMAETDAPTPVNLTNHAYWNFSGAGSGKVYDQLLQLFCSRYLIVDQDLVPTGDIAQVANTPVDFRTAKAIGKDIRAANGYDHCFILDESNETEPAKAAWVFDPSSGRGMEVFTTKPGIQFYSGNFLDGIKGAEGVYGQHDAFCLETQFLPDSMNHPNFSAAILSPGELYHHVTIHRFFIK